MAQWVVLMLELKVEQLSVELWVLLLHHPQL